MGKRLRSVEPRLSDPVAIQRILRLVFDDLGYSMAWAIERAKRGLSDGSVNTFRFGEFYRPRLDFETPVDLERFARGSRAILEAYLQAILEALDQAGLEPAQVDDVFLTGGTSHLPFIRSLFADLFGPAKLHSADAFTSVCEGLALS